MRVFALGSVFVLAICAASGCSSPSAATADGAGLKAFASEAELDRFARTMHKRERRRFAANDVELLSPPPPMMAVDAAPAEPAARDQITNVQEAGVDEGGIVKSAGDYLVVLRRGIDGHHRRRR